MYIEDEYTELKIELTKDIKKEIIAFANTKGGKIYIGIDDDGNIIGLKNSKEDLESLSGMIREGIKSDLTLYTSVNLISINDKDIIEINVMEAPNKPYYLTEKGIKNIQSHKKNDSEIKLTYEYADTDWPNFYSI